MHACMSLQVIMLLMTSFAPQSVCCAAQDNNYIQKGYRREMTLGESLRSVFKLHNETANIYSHLAGKSPRHLRWC